MIGLGLCVILVLATNDVVMSSSNYGCNASVTVVERCDCGFGVSGASSDGAGVQGRWYAYERVSFDGGLMSRARVPLHWCSVLPT